MILENQTFTVKSVVLQVDKLRPYPALAAADESLQRQIKALWGQDVGFIILSGAPGVGKTRAAQDYIDSLLADYNATHDATKCRITSLFPDFGTKVYSSAEIATRLAASDVSFVWDLVVLHPQYGYEDLIRGTRIVGGGGLDRLLEVREGILGFATRVTESLTSSAKGTPLPRGVLILDEINRAPIGQIFGEALYGIDRRGTPVATPYHLAGVGSTLTVPKSLFLIGTMNSIDRSISGFDFALRRRFSFLSMAANVEAIRSRWKDFGHDDSAGARLFESVKKAVLTATQRGAISKHELVIGHSFFIPPASVASSEDAIKWLAQSYAYQIAPTLADYREQGLVDYDEAIVRLLPAGDAILGTVAAQTLDPAKVAAAINVHDSHGSPENEPSNAASN